MLEKINLLKSNTYTKYALFLSILMSLAPNAEAFQPKEVIILRHAEKLIQKNNGSSLSAKGMARSTAIASFFKNHYQEYFLGEPDIIVATDPGPLSKNPAKSYTIRELQTVSPLSNMLAIEHPDKDYSIFHPLTSEQPEQMAKLLLTDPKFDGKIIVICWNNTNINTLTKALGVTQTLDPWLDSDYQKIYDIRFNPTAVLNPIPNPPYTINTKIGENWEILNNLINGVNELSKR